MTTTIGWTMPKNVGLYEAAPFGVECRVTDYSYEAVGGCSTATIVGTGNRMDLLRMLSRIGYGIELFDTSGEKVWWGYVNTIEVKTGAITNAVTMDNMANKVIVVYNDTGSGSTNQAIVGDLGQFTPLTNSFSSSLYGLKVLRVNLGDATSTQATNYGNTILNQRQLPPVVTSFGGPNSDADKLTITCKGWWSVLDWEYYSNSSTANATVGQQITNMISGTERYSRYLGSTVWLHSDILSAISSPQYRDGSKTVREEVERILKMGDGNGNRFLATYDSDLSWHFYVEPTPSTQNVMMYTDGRLRDASGGLVMGWRNMTTQWVDLPELSLDVGSAAINFTGRGFIEGQTYKPETGELSLRVRDAFSMRDVLTIV